MNPAPGRLGTYFPVRLRRRDDVHEIRPFLVEHLAVIGVVPRQAELLLDDGRPTLMTIAEGHDLDFRNSPPGFVLEVTEMARANTDPFQLRGKG